MKSTWNKKGFLTLAVAVLLMVLVTSLALADDISNSLDPTVDAVAEAMPLNVGGANGTTNLYIVKTNGDGKNGCNLTGSTTLVVSVKSSDTSVATVSPSSITFGSCGDVKPLMVKPVGLGTATISVSLVSNNTGATFNLDPAVFTVTVVPPPNSAPKVTVTGVAAGKSYEFGAVPAAGCQAADTEDGNSNPTPGISAITGPLADNGLGEQTVSCTYTDGGGLTASASVTYSIVDTTAPAMTLTNRTLANNNGWNNGDVTVSWTCSDLVSGVTSATVETTVKTEGANQSATGTCEDKSGNKASSSISGINIDLTPPSVSGGTPNRPADNNGWYNHTVDVVFSGSDGLSGIASCDTIHYSGPDGASISAAGLCVDRAGNTSASAASSAFNFDATKPTAQLVVKDGTQGDNGWYTTDVTVSTQGAGGVSGVTCTGDQYQTEETGGAAFNGSCMIGAGLTSEAVPLVVRLDKTAPTDVASSVTGGTLGDNGWYTSNVTVSTTGMDAISGVTCTPDQYQTVETTAVVFQASCTNGAGLETEAAPLTVKLDKTAPTNVALSVTDGAPGANGWYVSDVTVHTSGSDSISGAACTGDQSQTAETAGAAFNGSCTNGAGLKAEAAPLTVKLDKTAPTITWNGGPADGAIYYYPDLPAAPTCASGDALSGPGSCTVTGYAASYAPHTMTATAYDQAGNVKVETRSYTYSAWTLRGFYQPVDMPTSSTMVYNTVKNGSTVPLKFEVFAGLTELTDPASVVKSLTYAQTTYSATATSDEIETIATGGTTLRYDAAAGQFIYNWKTPAAPGKCYRVTMTTKDDSTLVAYFKLK